MDCETCKNESKIISVPYLAYESYEARHDRKEKRLLIALIISVFLMFASNAVWLWAWMQYDYTSEEIVTTYQQDGRGLNIIGDNNEVDRRGAEENSYCTEEDQTP